MPLIDDDDIGIVDQAKLPMRIMPHLGRDLFAFEKDFFRGTEK